jgi:hypothetical protein
MFKSIHNLTMAVLASLFCNLTYASEVQANFQIEVNNYKLLWMAPQNLYIDRGKIMFPLLGLIYITRGFEDFRTTTGLQSPDIRLREFIAPSDFSRFVKIDSVSKTVTIHLLNAVGEPKIRFDRGAVSVTKLSGKTRTVIQLERPIQMLNNNPELTFVGLSDLAKIFRFTVVLD